MRALLLLALLIGCCPAFCFDEEKPITEYAASGHMPRVLFTTKTDLVSAYIFRGQDMYDDRAAIQPSASVTFTDCYLSFTGWGSFSLAGREKKEVRKLDEFDISVVFRPRFDIFEFGIGHTEYVFYNFDKMAANTGEFFTELRIHAPWPVDVASLDGFMMVAYDYDQGNGAYARAGIDAAIVGWTNGGVTLSFPMGMHAGYNHAQYYVRRSISDVDFYAGIRYTAEVLLVGLTMHFTLTPERTINPHDKYEIWGMFTMGARF